MKEGIEQIESVWKQFVKSKPFDYEFIDDRYSRLYASETSQQELFFIFAMLAIFIASLGLFGLATFNTIQRSKEVSIRKVLGASVQSILQLLSKEIVILILIANVVAWPLAWYFMKEWLAGFAYRIEMNMLPYLAAGTLTLIVTLIIVSTQTLKAALMNPATNLRSE
jgi:putative ABC transport system permease protein